MTMDGSTHWYDDDGVQRCHSECTEAQRIRQTEIPLPECRICRTPNNPNEMRTGVCFNCLAEIEEQE
jgi:hypothetical protein